MSTQDEPTRMITPDEGAALRGLAAGQKVFERYRLETIAGRGGMGVVWRARDEELDRVVALKFLPEAVSADAEAVRDLKIETKRCLDLTHPQIVRVYDFVHDSTATAIAMEFVEGESLATRKAASPNGCLTVPEVARFTGQLCAALDYAHFKAHVLHRDLKPANLIIASDGDLKVMDFGIACSLAETRTRQTAMASRSTSGTPLYMSPQHLMGEKPSVADDVYSLGATLYELLTSKPPFYRGDGISLMMQVREKVPKPMAEQLAELQIVAIPIPPLWEKVILSCLAKDPKDRPASAGEVADQLGLSVAPTQGSSSRKVPVMSPLPPHVEARSPATEKNLPIPEIVPATAEIDLPVVGNINRPQVIFGLLAALVVIGLMFYILGLTSSQPRAAVAASRPIAPTTSSGAAPLVFPAPAEPKKTAAPSVDPRGGVIVRTEPAGAEVTVGALDRGVGPLTVREVKLGTYPVHVRAPGYEDWTGEVEVKENDFTEVKAELVRSTGTLLVTSEPGGLEAEVVGKATPNGPTPGSRQQVTTPQKVKLPTGAYEIVFHRSGWPDQHTTAEVTREQLIESGAAFVAGKLVVTSVPAGAKVFANGKEIGLTPLALPEVQPGSQALEMRLTGYQAVSMNGVIVARKQLEFNATLVRYQMPEAGKIAMVPELDLEMAYVAPTTFTMGSPESEAHHSNAEGPLTQVTLTQGYWLGKNEVTQGQYEMLIGSNPSRFKAAGKDAPVENVSWTDAMEFCRRLTERERTEGRLPAAYAYTLPSEAQWEEACRAGTTTPYAGKLGELAWFDKQGGKTTHPGGQKSPNAWGFFDMHGNVSEWCLDLYADHLPGGSVTDYDGPATGSKHVYRGGGWDASEEECRSAFRFRGSPGDHDDNLGFRVALSVPQIATVDSLEAKASKSGFMGGVKSAFGSVVKVFKPGDKSTDATAGTLTVTIDHAPAAPLQFNLTLVRTDGVAGSLNFPIDEAVTKGRMANGAFVAKLPVPAGNYTFVVKATGFKDVTQSGKSSGDGQKKDQINLKTGVETGLELELVPATTSP